MHYRVRKAIKKGKKWSSVYCKHRFKSMPKIGDKEFDDFVQRWGDGSYIILDDQSKYIGSIKVDRFGYRRRANKRGQIIKPSKFPSKHQRVPECVDCYKKGFLSGVKKTRERAKKVIQKRNVEIIKLRKQLINMSKSQSIHTPIRSQMNAGNQISKKYEKKSSKQIAKEEINRNDIEEFEGEDVEIIECPGCGFRVSTNDSSCSRCGFDSEEEDEEYENEAGEEYEEEEDEEYKDEGDGEIDEVLECPECGAVLPGGLVECLECGTEFEDEEEDIEECEEEDEDVIECPKCETPLEKDPENDRYNCPNCRNEYLISYVCPFCDIEFTLKATQCPKCHRVFEENEVIRMIPICPIHKTPMSFFREEGFICLLCKA